MSNESINNSRFLVAQDWSAWGNISLKLATIVFTVWDVPAAMLPVRVLATHPGWQANPPSQSLTTLVQQTLTDWTPQQISGLYLGFLGSCEQVQLWSHFAQSVTGLVLVDPAMADHGHLYAGLNQDYVQAQKSLLKTADVLTPNVTEAQLLTGIQITNEQNLRAAMMALQAQMRGQLVVITSIQHGQQIGCAYLTQQQLHYVLYPRQTKGRFGSGDLFSSLLACFLFSRAAHNWAIDQATRLTNQAVRQTPTEAPDVCISAILPELWQLKRRFYHE